MYLYSCKLYSVYILYIEHGVLAVYRILYAIYCILYTIYCTRYTFIVQGVMVVHVLIE